MGLFTGQSIFGLDISDYSVECLLLAKKIGKLGVKSYSRLTSAANIVENGVILDKKFLAEKIVETRIKARPRRIASKKVILSLPESKTFIHLFKSTEIPGGPEIKKGIISEASRIIPLDLQETYNDFVVYKNGDVLFAAVSKKIVDDYIEVMKEAKLELVAIDLESLSIGRALFFEGGDLKENVMVVDIGSRTTDISIFNKLGELQISATINIAGNKFTQAIAEELGSDFEGAEKLKTTHGLDENGDKRVFEVLKKQFSPIIEKIKDLTEYYQEKIPVQNGSTSNIEKILLVGGSAKMPEIASHFSKNLNIRTELGRSKVAEQIKEFAPCESIVGLALRSLQDNPVRAGINLLPSICQKKSFFRALLERKIKLWVALTLLIVEALFLVIGFMVIIDRFDNLIQGIKISKYNGVVMTPQKVVLNK